MNVVCSEARCPMNAEGRLCRLKLVSIVAGGHCGFLYNKKGEPYNQRELALKIESMGGIPDFEDAIEGDFRVPNESLEKSVSSIEKEMSENLEKTVCDEKESEENNNEQSRN